MFDYLTVDLLLESSLITVAGLVVHIVKKCMNKGISPIEYLSVFKGRTSLAITSIVTGYITVIVVSPEAGPAEFFALGYVLDSIVNKAPSTEEVDHDRRKKQNPETDK